MHAEWKNLNILFFFWENTLIACDTRGVFGAKERERGGKEEVSECCV